jgi:hypothetical protein
VGRAFGEANFFTGYVWRLPRKGHQLSLQLNITNLFDETDPIVTRYFANGDTKRTCRSIEREARAFRLTGIYSF